MEEFATQVPIFGAIRSLITTKEGNPMRRLALLSLILALITPMATGDDAKRAAPARIGKPVLLRLVGTDSLISEILVAGTPDQRVYFFRDPDGGRIRFEKKGDFTQGFTRRYTYVNGHDAAYVEIRDFYVFHDQGLPWPYIVNINGVSIAGFADKDIETKSLGKKVFAEFKKLPVGFQRTLYNFCVFGMNARGLEVDAGTTGLLLSENWLSPGLPDYQVTVIPAPPDDENIIPNFQRLFAE